MTPPLIFIFGLTVLPLVFMICMAFTNYSKLDNHLVLFDWVGLENFRTLFDSNSILGSMFWSVLAWTVIWAFFATFSNYIFGMILAMVINRPGTKAKSFWRFCFVLSCAVPSFVSLLIMRTMLQPDGAVNVLLRNLGLDCFRQLAAVFYGFALGEGDHYCDKYLGGRALYAVTVNGCFAEYSGRAV